MTVISYHITVTLQAITMFESLYLGVDLGNVAKWEEPFMECEWGYNLHNDALPQDDALACF
ncbi:hypothetical protein Tco_0795615, partial [Tanacetum coccineum]